MKKIIFTFCLFIVSMISRGQTTMFNEDFEGTLLVHDVPSTGPGWVDDQTLFVSGAHSYHGTLISANDTNILETDPFSDGGLGFGFITLSFDHIAKVDFFDRCIIEFSTDQGVSWIRMDTTNSTYLGSTAGASLSWPSFFSFMAISYPTWLPNDADTVPNNAWWVRESFDMSIAWPFQFDIRLRFKMYDGNNNGGSLNYGWNIDNINVTGAYCELTPPTMTQIGSLVGVVYGPAPYTASYDAVDASGVSYGYMVYSVTDSFGVVTVDSVPLVNVGGNTWNGTIPLLDINGDTLVNPTDTVCYYAYTVDNSGCFNYIYYPGAGCTSFYYAAAFGFPYCSDFDNLADSSWHGESISGSNWEHGLPQTPPINTNYNGIACWDVDLLNIYQSNTETYLYSPIFQWTGLNVKLSFWQNRDVEPGWDGVVLQCDTGASGNWFQIGAYTPNTFDSYEDGINWYNTGSIFSNNIDTGFWTGTSNGWEYSEIVLAQLNSFATSPSANKQVQFRFEFTSDGSGELSSFAIDQFCLELPPPFDVGVKAIIQPSTEPPAGDTSYVTVKIKNYGGNPVSAGSFDVQFSINAPAFYSGTATYTGNNIQPNASDTFTIPIPVIFPIGPFDICAWTEMATDGDNTNDTNCVSPIGIARVTAPYCDNFDTGSVAYWNGLASLSGFTAWELGTPTFGVINTPHSTPNAWKTNLNSTYDNDADAELKSPYFNFTQFSTYNSWVSFWMNRKIEPNSDELIFEYTEDNGLSWVKLGTVGQGTNWYNNPNGNPLGGPVWDGTNGGWQRVDYDLTMMNGKASVRFRFRFASDFNGGVAEGVAIDDFCIKPPVPDDPGIKRVIAPFGQDIAGTSLAPTVVIKNFGSNVLTSIPVSYKYNGANLTSGTFIGTLNPGDSVNFNTWAPFTVPFCDFTFEAYTEYPSDADMSNDSSGVLNVVGILKHILPISGPTCENFDTGSCWIDVPSPQNSTNWELGTPNFGATTGAFSPPNSWDVNLNSSYQSSAETYLYTSKYDFGSAVNATLSFQHNWNTEPGWDGTRVQYTIDNGVTWNTLGVYTPTTFDSNGEGVNWYNDDFIQSSTGPCWDDNSADVFGSQWVKSSHNLSVLDGEPDVQFRFMFTSDPSIEYDGVSVDDFCIRTPYPHDIGVSKIISPTPVVLDSALVVPQVEIKNYGSNTETTSPITYVMGTGSAITFTWTGSLAPNATTLVTLPTDTAEARAFSFCAWTELPGDGDLTNDTLCGDIFGIVEVVPTYADNFDSSLVNFVGVPGGASSATNWELGLPSVGATSSVHSPANCWDVNLSKTYGNNDSCFLYTPIFNLSNKKAPVLRFWHNYNLDNFDGDGVYVQYSFNGGNWKVLGVVQGQPTALNWYNSPNIFSSGTPGWNGNSGGWKFCYYALDTTIFNGAVGSKVQFRYVFKSDGFTQVDGYSVDDFELFIPVPTTIAPEEVKPVNNLITPGPQYVTAKIRNRGTQTVSTANVTLVVDSNIIVTDAVTFTPPLQGASYVLPGAYTVHTFSIPWNASPGLHNICVWTDSPNGLQDLNPADDTLCAEYTVFDSVSIFSSNPYCTDFEGGPQWVTLNAITYAQPNNWQVGLPAKACLNSAHSGGNAWSTLLAANYPNRDTSALFTPVFNVDVSKCYKLSFWHKYDTEQFQDGGAVEYSIDSGNTWFLLGFGGEPNWYNSVFVTGLGGTPRGGFSGANCVWTQAAHEYAPNEATVIFRFHFGSDFTYSKEGWEIDDVCFEELPAPCTVGIIDPGAMPGLELGQNYPNPATNETSFDYTLPENGNVLIELTDLMGQVVMTPVSGMMASGKHTVSVNSASLAPGIFFYTLKFNNHMLVKKMVIAR